MASAAPAMNPIQLNALQRSAVIGQSQKMTQLIRSVSVDTANDPIVTIPVRPVGLVLGFIIEVSGTIANGITNVATRTGLGSANIMKNVVYTDLNNVQRVNTRGSLLALLNSARQGFGFGGAYAPNLPMSYGNNWSPFAGAATLAASATGTVKHTYYLPLAYSSTDLRGAVYSNVVNATQQIQITVQDAPGTLAGDPLDKIYTGNATLDWSGNVTVNVYQVYLDQLPQGPNGTILPLLDLNTIYDIKQTAVNGLSAGQEFPVPYANYRAFLSTFAIYDNAGVFNSGSDVSYWAMKSANSTELFRYTPDIAALLARQTFMADPPPGVYYFDHRDAPIDTITFGNMELVLNPSAVTAGAQLIMGYEAFQQIQNIPMSSSLSVGA